MITPQQIDDQQLAERYLAGQLAEAEQAEFEEYYSEHPQLLQDLQAVAGIKVGLALLRSSGELEQLRTPRYRPGATTLALAASLLMAVIVGYLLRGEPQPSAVMAAAATTLMDASGAPLRILSTYDLQRTRSDVDVTITKPAGVGAVKLRLREALEPPPASYRLELLAISADDTRSARAALDALTLDEHGLLNVYLDPAVLAAGNYEMRLFKEAAGAERIELSDFLIEIVAPSSEAEQLEGRTESDR